MAGTAFTAASGADRWQPHILTTLFGSSLVIPDLTDAAQQHYLLKLVVEPLPLERFVTNLATLCTNTLCDVTKRWLSATAFYNVAEK